MAERPLRTDDFPTYDEYPGPESPATPRAGEDYVPTTLQQPAYAEGAAHPHRAQQVGGGVGRAVSAVRRAGENIRERFEVVRGGGHARMEDLKHQAGEQADRLKHEAQRRYADVRDRAQRAASQARDRARRVANEQPLKVVAAAFAAAFLIGAALRIGRSRG